MIKMEIIIIPLIMLVCEIIFTVVFNIIRYNNYKAEKMLFPVMLFYSVFWLYFVIEGDENDWIISYIYLIGVFQGIGGIVEYVINKKIYQEKREYIYAFEKSTFFILSLDRIEKYTIEELRLLKSLSEESKGQKCTNILFIQKDMKNDKVMLMFFLRKPIDNLDIEEYCEKNYLMEEIREHNRKRVIISYLK